MKQINRLLGTMWLPLMAKFASFITTVGPAFTDFDPSMSQTIRTLSD